MQYPLISEYVNSILNAEDNFATQTELRPVLNDDGTPVMSSGNFAVVFKMKDERDGKLYAVKCFTREQEGRAENYRMIAEELEKVSSPYITPIKWLDGELFVDTKQTDETEFPVLLMDWIEGPTLSAFLQSIADQLAEGKVFKDNEYEMFELRCLPANFLRMASWLLKQPFAHGDLKPDNIIVQEDGYCVLVDYDGMYVPAMQGMPLTCMGTPNFTHPSQTNNTLNKDIDNYAIPVIALSLQVFALKPSMIAESPDCCVITKQQALKLHTLILLNDEELMANNNIQSLLSLFLHCLSQNKLESSYFDHAIAEILVPKGFDVYKTSVSDDDFINCYIDKYGICYSLDGRKALKDNPDYYLSVRISYRIREGVLSICDQCFAYDCIQNIILPDSVISIGELAFAYNRDLCSFNIPRLVAHVAHNNPWTGCYNIKKIKCDSPNYLVSDGVLYTADYTLVLSLLFWHSNINIDIRANEIASNAFMSFDNDCNIQYLDLSNIVSIGEGAFAGCKSIEHINVSRVRTIGSQAFQDCTSLTTIALSKQLAVLNNMVFQGCKSLKAITIPSSVVSIEDAAFKKCESLESIVIPNSVLSLGKEVFEGCKSLKAITIPSSVVSIEDAAFKKCESLESIVIPNSVLSLGKEGFEGCTQLQSISLPRTVAKIGACAFHGCISLKDIAIPDITIIEECAFLNCKALQSITIPPSVTDIKSVAFSGCESLKTITIPPTVCFIGYGAFSECISLQSVIFSSSIEDFGNEVFSLFGEPQHVTIPSSVTTIGERTFYNCSSLKSISLPISVSVIGESAFEKCHSLQAITIPPFVTRIENNTFNECTFLKSLTLPSSIEFLGEDSFLGCISLKTITILSSDKFIDCGTGLYYAMSKEFRFCNQLEKIIVEGICKYYLSIEGVLYDDNLTQLLLYPKGMTDSTFEVPGCVESISQYAFAECSLLQHVIIPSSVKSIERSAFENCHALVSLTIPTDLKIGFYAFRGCSSIQTINIISQNQSMDIDKLPFGFHYVSDIFNGEYDYYEVFGGCKQLKEILIDEKNQQFTSIDGILFNKNCSTLLKYPQGKDNNSYVIPPFVNHIKAYAFYKCESLRSITFPSSDIWIEDNAFFRCEALESIEIPFFASEIEKKAFSTCRSLKHITVVFLSSDNIEDLYDSLFCTEFVSFDYSPFFDLYISTGIRFSASFKSSDVMKYWDSDNIIDLLEDTCIDLMGRLKTIIVDSDNEDYTSLDDVLYNKKCTELLKFPKWKQTEHFDIPLSVTRIRCRAFNHCSTLRSIAIPSSVTDIEENAIIDCLSLKKIIIPKCNVNRIKKMLPEKLHNFIVETEEIF